MPLDRDSCDVFSSQYKVCEVEVCGGKTVGSPLRASHARSGGLSHARARGRADKRGHHHQGTTRNSHKRWGTPTRIRTGQSTLPPQPPEKCNSR